MSEKDKAKEYLLQIKDKHLAVKLAKQRYSQDYELIFGGGGIDYSKERVGGGKNESGNKTVEMMVDRWRDIEKMEREYLGLTKEASERVAKVTCFRGKEVLMRRYLLIPKSGRLTSFEQITEDLGLKDIRHTQRIHAKGLKELNEKFFRN